MAATLVFARRLKVHKCNHGEGTSAAKCIELCIGENNEERFVIASQDPSLKSTLRGLETTGGVLLTTSAVLTN